VYFALLRLPLTVGIAAYLIGITLLLAVVALGGWRLGEAGVSYLAASFAEDHPIAGARARAVAVDGDMAVARQAAMTPLADRWDDAPDRPQSRRSNGLVQLFGGSGRSTFRRNGEDEDGSAPNEPDGGVPTYRTVCVRLCDGYYFPISFSVSADRLGRDKAVCESRCGAQGRLFLQRSPGASADDLQDLSGRPYSKLPTAFRYRSEYVAGCKCQPDPWEAAALERHRLYSLAAAARKGDKAAAKELAEKTKEAAKSVSTARTAAPATPEIDPAAAAASLAKANEVAGRDGGSYMGLGTDGAPKSKSETAQPKRQGEADWVKRIFAPGATR
jgi:hypothetical protein